MAVLSNPLHPAMGRLLLIKPESFFDKVADGLLRESQPLRAEMTPEEIESLLDTQRYTSRHEYWGQVPGMTGVRLHLDY
jgi:hypothetical protein